MRRYLTSICAVLIAIGSVSFSNDDLTTSTYRYVPPSFNDYSTSSVENPFNWVLTQAPNFCIGANKACRVEIDNTMVQNPNAVWLGFADPNIMLFAEPGSLEAALYSVEVFVPIHVSIANQF